MWPKSGEVKSSCGFSVKDIADLTAALASCSHSLVALSGLDDQGEELSSAVALQPPQG